MGRKRPTYPPIRQIDDARFALLGEGFRGGIPMRGLQGQRGARGALVQRCFAGERGVAAALGEHDPAVLAVRRLFLVHGGEAGALCEGDGHGGGGAQCDG